MTALDKGAGTGTGVSVPLREKMEILRRAILAASGLLSTSAVVLATSAKEAYSISGMLGD